MMTEVKSIEVPGPLGRLGETFKEAEHELYLVGGFVRDALSGSIGRDVDATTGAHPKEIKRLLAPVADHLWTVGERFGTIGARVGDYDVEVTTYRTDLYTEGSRHPKVRFGKNLAEDLARRDFTINAIAADAETGEVQDPCDGRRDLESGVIRSVGDPVDRMRDDPLRMLRAVRFETVLSTPEKPFAMTTELEAAIRENAHWLESISAERIRDEVEKIL
ncbi:MAG: CCA tRNA nucleotidyltransferase, partial [Actinomycetota bacterium]|nr:CCA tRNA nucleotidyltransferase [Actinomycetota bacterium]